MSASFEFISSSSLDWHKRFCNWMTVAEFQTVFFANYFSIKIYVATLKVEVSKDTLLELDVLFVLNCIELY